MWQSTTLHKLEGLKNESNLLLHHGVDLKSNYDAEL